MRHRSPVLWNVIIFLAKISWASRDKSSSSSNLAWISPSPNTKYSSGDIITGEWTSSKAILSPSVKLCTLAAADSGDTSDDSGANCGGAVWPTVKQDGDNYSIVL